MGRIEPYNGPIAVEGAFVPTLVRTIALFSRTANAMENINMGGTSISDSPKVVALVHCLIINHSSRNS